jgi:hypothetical protein
MARPKIVAPQMAQIAKRCGSCVYGKKPETPESGATVARAHIDCRRYPNIVQKHADEWCGEFLA